MILDSGVLLVARDHKDPRCERARAVLSGEVPTIHAVNMGEVTSKILQWLPTSGAGELDLLYASPHLQVSYAPVERIAGTLHARRPTKKVSLADCFAAALALTRDDVLATTDRDLLAYSQSDGLKIELLA